MNKFDFYNISIRGMVAYCIMCLENYVLETYPDRDFSPILQPAWTIVGDQGFIDQNADRYMETIPEYLFEFDDYGEAEFDYLTEEEFDKLKGLLNPNDKVLNLVMHRIYDIAMTYAYVAVANPPKEATDLVFDVVRCLKEHGTLLPDFELVRSYSFSEFDGWGIHIDPEGLSKLL